MLLLTANSGRRTLEVYSIALASFQLERLFDGNGDLTATVMTFQYAVQKGNLVATFDDSIVDVPDELGKYARGEPG